MVKRFYIAPLFFFLFLSSILIFCWFRFGHIYGGGDTGLPTLNPKVMVGIAKYIWWSSLAPGIPVAQGVTSVPLLFFLSIPQSLGASPVFIQAFLFFVLLFLMGYGMYLLALHIFGKSNYLLAISAGVFYIFNPYMMIQVWHRFIYNAMVFVAFLPFLIITWRLWIKNHRPRDLFLFLLVNFLAVYIFGTIAFIVAVWTLFFLLTLLESLVPWKGRKVILKTFLFFLIGFIFWLLTNSWWLIPTFNVSPALFASVHSTNDSLNTLMSLSSSSILPYTLRLINPFYLYWEADFGTLYQSILFHLISWLPVLVVIVGFLRGLQQKKYVIWSILFLIVIFLSKGAAPPFNYPFIWGFSHFFPLGVIRNPFEKLGVILPFIYAILFALGLQYLFSYFTKTIGRPLTVFLLIVFTSFHMAFFWPMFAGKLFGTLKKQNFVEVPKSYTQSDNWIRNDIKESTLNTEGRILHLPLPRTEDATYKWPYGYHGVEPSAAIFTSLPSIARGLDINGINSVLSGLSLIFHKSYALNQDLILKMLQDFSIKYIILHKDIEWLGGELYNPQETEIVLSSLHFLQKKEVFGDLILYKLKDNFFSPKIRIIENVQYYISPENNTYWPMWLSTDNIELLSKLKDNTKDLLLERQNEILLSAQNIYKYKPQKIVNEKILIEMPAVRILPDSFLYPLIRMKESIQRLGLSSAEEFPFKITLAGKRLIEAYFLKEKGSPKSIKPLLKEYQQLLPKIKESVRLRAAGKAGLKEIPIHFTLSRHLATLALIKDKSANDDKIFAEDTLNRLNNFLRETNIIPMYSIVEESVLPNTEYLISEFNLPYTGKYELLQAHQQVKDIYPDDLNKNTFQINNEVNDLIGTFKGDLISYGWFDLSEGINEISFNSIPSINLAKLSENSMGGNVKKIDEGVEVISDLHDPSYIDIEIDPLYGGNWYRVTFDSWVKLGNIFKILVLQDTDYYDPKKPGEKKPFYDNDFPKDSYSNFWEGQVYNFYIKPTTTKAIIRLIVSPWDGCRFLQPIKFCINDVFRAKFERVSQAIFKNFSVVRLLTNPIFLRSPALEGLTPSSGKIDFTKKEATSYSGRVTVTGPAWVVFKESFDTGWELKLTKNNRSYEVKYHLMANLFANGWLIKEPGDYDFTLEFNPQKLINIGLFLAGLGWIIVLIVYLRYNFHGTTIKDET